MTKEVSAKLKSGEIKPQVQQRRYVGMLSNDAIPEEYRMLLERFKEIRGGFNARVSE